jgi:hypothetical protein
LHATILQRASALDLDGFSSGCSDGNAPAALTHYHHQLSFTSLGGFENMSNFTPGPR